MATAPAGTGVADHEEQHRLTAAQGLAALSLDAMASVAYGPEAIVLVLAAAGSYGLGFTLPVTAAIALLLAVLTASYRQVIAAFPDGGGSYAVAKAHLGRRAALVAAASLVIDYILNVAVSVTAGVAALTSAFPALYDDRVLFCLGVLALVTAVNLRGIAESATAVHRALRVFIMSIIHIVGGLFRSRPAVPRDHQLGPSTGPRHATAVARVRLRLLRADRRRSHRQRRAPVPHAAGPPRPAHRGRARHLARHHADRPGVCIDRFHLGPLPLDRACPTRRRVPRPTSASTGPVRTMVLLALAANTSFGGLPVLAALLARDNYLPHIFGLRADRQVHRYGVLFPGIVSAALLIGSNGEVDSLVPLFAIGVFVGFTICQIGMVRHWRVEAVPRLG